MKSLFHQIKEFYLYHWKSMTPQPEVHTMKMVCMWYSNKYNMLHSTLIWMTSQLIKCVQFIQEYNQLLFVATYKKDWYT